MAWDKRWQPICGLQGSAPGGVAGIGALARGDTHRRDLSRGMIIVNVVGCHHRFFATITGPDGPSSPTR
jgi:hypothetical protein